MSPLAKLPIPSLAHAFAHTYTRARSKTPYREIIKFDKAKVLGSIGSLGPFNGFDFAIARKVIPHSFFVKTLEGRSKEKNYLVSHKSSARGPKYGIH